MRTIVRYALPCAGLLVLAGGGCAGRQQRSAEAPTSRDVETAQRQSQQALNKAAEAQRKASEQGDVVARAQREVQDAQRRLIEAQQRMKTEQQKAEVLQQQAIQARMEANRQAQEAQQAASRALAQQGQYVQREEQTFSGQVTQATPSAIVVTPQIGEPMTFRVNDQTRVQIDGRQASAADIRQGGDARVAYQMSGAGATATVVQVITGEVGPTAQPPRAAQPQGTAPSTPPPPSAQQQ